MSDTVDVIELATKKFTPAEIGCAISNTFRYTCEVHCATKNLTSGDQVFLVDKAVFRDYEDNFADVIQISLSFPMGTFMYDVYDSLENLEITLKELSQFYKSAGAKSDTSPHSKTTRYKAIFLKDKNTALPTTRSVSRSDMNQQLPVVVVFQLIEKAAEAIRIKTTDGSFSDKKNGITREQFLRTTMSQEISKILVDNQPPIDVFDIAKFDNNERLMHLLIPTNTRLVELPDYLQEKLGGIYNDGLSCYVQTVMQKPGEYKNTLAIFNLYNPDSPGTADSLIYCVNNDAKTTQYVGGIPDPSGKGVHLLAHRLTGIEDDMTTEALNRGTGFRATDSSKIMHGSVIYRPGGAVFDRGTTNTEVVGQERGDGGNFAINKGITSNNLALATDVFKRSGKYVTIQISNLDHYLIAPGKKYEIHYLSNETLSDGIVKRKMMRRYAYVLQMMTSYTNNNPDMTLNSNNTYVEFTSHTTLKMIVGKVLNLESE